MGALGSDRAKEMPVGRKLHIARDITIFVLLLAVLTAAAEDSPSGRRFYVGACTHFSQGKGLVEANLDSLQAAGISAIRDEAPWGVVEREKGKLVMPERFDTYVRRAAAKGLTVMLILDYANRFYDDGDRPRSPEAIEGFCRYSEFVVQRFGDDVKLYEVWNEWDIGIGLPERHRKGGSPEDYVTLLRAVYPRIKAANPEATVIAGGSTSGGVKRGWLEGILKLGALDYCDAISIHSYNYNDRFPQRGPEACAAWMARVRAVLRKYNDGASVPFYVTEMGWPTHVTKGGTDPELSASYLARLYLLAREAPSFQGLWWYDFQDDGWNPEHNENNFGMVRPDLTPKPGYYVVADISELVAKGTFVDRLATGEDLRVFRFRCDGHDRWTLWSADDQDRQVILHTRRPVGTIAIQVVGRDAYAMRWGYRDWVGRGQFVPDRVSVVVGHRPVIVSGDLSDVTIVDTILRVREVGEQSGER
jgi:hypothetical protein